MQAVDYVVRDASGRLFKGSLEAQAETLVLRVSDYSAVSLNLSRDLVEVYNRVGDNLVIKLEDGREIVLENMFVAQNQGTQLYFSSGGEIYEISFSEAWGRTNYAHYGETDGTAGMVFSDGTQLSTTLTGVTTDAGYAITTAAEVEATMAAAPVFAGLGGGGVGAIGAGVLGAGVIAGVAGSGGASTILTVAAVLSRDDGISIITAGTGSDLVINNTEAEAGPVVTGQTYPNSLVTVTFDGASFTATSDADGMYSVTFPAITDDVEKTIEVSASVVNPDGDVETTQTDVDIDTVTNVAIADTIVEGDGTILANEINDGVVITGSSEAGANVVVTVLDVTRTVTAGADGSWSVTFDGSVFTDINNQTVVVNAVATDAFGNTATTNETVRVDTVLDVAIDPTQAGDNVINSAEAQAGVTFTGTTNPQASVQVELDGTVIDATVGANGAWSVTFPPSELPSTDGPLTITANATDNSGNTASTTHDVTFDTAGMVRIDSADLEIDDIINASEQSDGVTITGSTLAGSTVVVTFQNFTGDATVDASGNWTIDIPASGITLGEDDVEISATATTASGNVTQDTEMVRVDTLVNALTVGAVAGDDVINETEYNDGVTLTGTVEVGSSVNVTLAGVSKGATVAANGTWSATFAAGDIPDGDYPTTMFATATDSAGNVLSTIARPVRIDTLVSEMVLSDIPIGGGDNVISGSEAQTGIPISGVSEPGVTVTVSFNGSEVSTVADENGNWTILLGPDQIGEGEFTTPLIVTTTDSSGNTNSTPPQDITIDTLVNNVDIPIEDTAGDGIINSAESQTTIPLTGNGEPGAQVNITIDGEVYTGVVGDDGIWVVDVNASLLPTGETTVAIEVTLTDAAGNTSSENGTIVIDTFVNQLVVTGSTMDSVNVVNVVVADGGINLAGVVEAGATISVTFEGTTNVATVDVSGNWSVTFTNEQIPVGTYTANAVVTATDTAGNMQSVTSQFIVDTTVPEAPVITDVRVSTRANIIGGITVETTDDIYELNSVSEDGSSSAEITFTTDAGMFNGTTDFNFDPGISLTNDIIIDLEDTSGNQAATLLVLTPKNGDMTAVDMGAGAYSDYALEVVDLVDAENAVLTITEDQLVNLSEFSDTLLVRGDDLGDGGNTVIATDAVDTGVVRTVDGNDYNVYTMGDTGTLLIDQGIDVQI